LAWYGKSVEPAISECEAHDIGLLSIRFGRFRFRKNSSALFTTEKQSTRRCTEKPDASVLLSRKSFATLATFLARPFWSAQACLRLSGAGATPHEQRRQQAAALQRAQWNAL